MQDSATKLKLKECLVFLEFINDVLLHYEMNFNLDFTLPKNDLKIMIQNFKAILNGKQATLFEISMGIKIFEFQLHELQAENKIDSTQTDIITKHLYRMRKEFLILETPSTQRA
jgi:hypothetical protein